MKRVFKIHLHWRWRMGAVLAVVLGGCSQAEIGKLKDCADWEQEAEELIESAASCEADADCIVSGVGSGCIPAFACYAALNKNADFDSLNSEASSLGKSYEQSACGCVMADCVDPSVLEAHCSSGTCKLK